MQREWVTKDVWDAWLSKSREAKTNHITEKEGIIMKHTFSLYPFVVQVRSWYEFFYNNIFNKYHFVVIICYF